MTMSELLTAPSSIPLGRRRLATVLRQAGDLVRTTDVVSALDVNRSAASKLFGTRSVWRSRSRVMVSIIHRTIVAMLDDPAIGGGGQHVADCVAARCARPRSQAPGHTGRAGSQVAVWHAPVRGEVARKITQQEIGSGLKLTAAPRSDRDRRQKQIEIHLQDLTISGTPPSESAGISNPGVEQTDCRSTQRCLESPSQDSPSISLPSVVIRYDRSGSSMLGEQVRRLP